MHEIRSDQGSNIMVAEKELRTALEEMDHSAIKECLYRDYKADRLIK